MKAILWTSEHAAATEETVRNGCIPRSGDAISLELAENVPIQTEVRATQKSYGQFSDLRHPVPFVLGVVLAAERSLDRQASIVRRTDRIIR